jgi:hypothetical protein
MLLPKLQRLFLGNLCKAFGAFRPGACGLLGRFTLDKLAQAAWKVIEVYLLVFFVLVHCTSLLFFVSVCMQTFIYRAALKR